MSLKRIAVVCTVTVVLIATGWSARWAYVGWRVSELQASLVVTKKDSDGTVRTTLSGPGAVTESYKVGAKDKSTLVEWSLWGAPETLHSLLFSLEKDLEANVFQRRLTLKCGADSELRVLETGSIEVSSVQSRSMSFYRESRPIPSVQYFDLNADGIFDVYTRFQFDDDRRPLRHTYLLIGQKWVLAQGERMSFDGVVELAEENAGWASFRDGRWIVSDSSNNLSEK